MSQRPEILTVRQLFDGSRRYRVPIYQRAYAWGPVEIETLVLDIASVLDRSAHYYIGSLVLHEVRDVDSDRPLFDVIDGQQRLTTLFIMLTHPELRPVLEGFEEPFQITDRLVAFEERKRSNRDLAALARPGTQSVALDALQDDGIKAGVATMSSLFSEAGLDRIRKTKGPNAGKDPGLTSHQILEYLLDHVQIVLTELPADTDLNHYFEVMNTRGEQLEKHEIVKAQLLGLIGAESGSRALFSTVWDACSDFTHHIQARFEPEVRSALFGKPNKAAALGGWSALVPQNAGELAEILGVSDSDVDQEERTLDKVLEAPTPRSEQAERDTDDGDAGRYGAIIDFPNFLLHVLRLHAMGSDHDVSLDDKKLVDQFQRTVTTSAEAMDFAFRLLRTKFLFDNFVIKPLDEPGRSDDSNWVIHRMHYTQPEGGRAKLSPLGAFGADTKQVLMLQSMYQVTNQRRVYKEFLYQLLKHLDEAWDGREITAEGFIRHLHGMADSDLAALELETDQHTSKLDAGTSVPHFALNLLDYKLWYVSEIEKARPEGLPEVKATTFRFAYRTSIEHFLPVNLTQTDAERRTVDCLGNLCLMSRSENSLRSDHTPDWKVTKYGTTDQSLKFYYMAALQKQCRAWGPAQIEESGRAMKAVLFRSLPAQRPATPEGSPKEE